METSQVTLSVRGETSPGMAFKPVKLQMFTLFLDMTFNLHLEVAML